MQTNRKKTGGIRSALRTAWARWLKHAVTLLLFTVVAALLFSLVRNMEWQAVVETLRGYSPALVVMGVGVTAASFAVFSSYDLLGKWYTGHTLPITQVLPLAFVCYAFNLNLGAWVGGIALRYRLYTQFGLSVATVTRVLSVSLTTNWLGYMLLAGALFTLGYIELPPHWHISTLGLQLVGAGLLVICLSYLLASRYSRRRIWRWREHDIVLPSLRLALLQLLLGAVNWSLMAVLVYLLLPQGVFYPTVLAILLVSSIAGVVTHIPAGLGVLEAVFIAMLQHQLASSEIIAALIGYRAIYFLFPLVVACMMYLLLERWSKRKTK
ncbi:lysylphosphatidylglycerol synthase domain-containing protein [Vreelandella sp. V005]|uniref:lysylphosphatidylglycerol synthase domain-containing protein n=1 Tax=Vreelandella sp. V005 TaxID=3459608 RepID=UPI0040450DAC